MPLRGLKQFILPQEGLFFDRLEKQAQITHTAAEALERLLHDYKNVDEQYRQIKELENRGDELLHDLYAELNRSFIVPIDHSDISSLASELDDVLDLVYGAAKCLTVYEVRAPSAGMIRLSELLTEQTRELKRAVESIKHANTFGNANGCCVEINRLENEADEIYTKAVAELFKRTDPIEIIKQKEILDSIEFATDKVEKAANVVSDIVMKHS